MSDLEVNPLVYTDLIFPTIKKPKLEGYFSVDVNRRYINNLRNLKYYNVPSDRELKFDLNSKLSCYYEKSEETKEEKLDLILEYILINYDSLINVNENCLNCGFVSYRGLLRKIMNLPYEKSEDLIVLATRFKNTIYLCSKETDRKISECNNRTEDVKKFLKFGHIFEHFVMSDEPNKPPDTSQDINESEEFCCMFSTKLEKHHIFYGAEVDGVKSKTVINNLEQLRNSELVELKLKRRENNDRQVQNFYRFKTKNWWAQSFLVGIENIHVGLRDDTGVVDEIIKMPLRDLVHKSKQYWSASICLKFLNDFLTKVKKDMSGINCPNTVFMYQFDPLKDKEITLIQFKGKNVHTFLPRRYVNFLK